MLIEKVHQNTTLLNKHGINTEIKGPLPKSDLIMWEGLLDTVKIELPDILKRIFLEETSEIIFSWETTKIQFGDSCKRGYLHLLSPDKIATTYREMLEIVQECLRDPDVSSNPGIQALVADWPKWIPVFAFPNGDAFCIDIRNSTIVFLEHDVMDGGPFIHGTTIARSLEHLIELWNQVAFADAFDWSQCCDDHGIILESPLFESIRLLK